ncbi:MAG: hypothetical protein KKB70_02820 [Proteobacteria bacterium]|nr:hypothetical protein [Pseudomonadota bacterium]MBU1612036.1 hypothetical protein [Pseudomonadota bacterium]
MSQKESDKGVERLRHTIVLPNDHGREIPVSGYLEAEDMHFNNADGMLTVEKIFDLENGKRAYGVISAIGHSRERRAYLIEEKDDTVHMSNGSVTLDTPTDILLELLAMALQAEEEQHNSNASCEHMLDKLAANQ